VKETVMKIVIVKGNTKVKKIGSCPYLVDIPPEANKK
jgi:hypothetical protein